MGWGCFSRGKPSERSDISCYQRFCLSLKSVSSVAMSRYAYLRIQEIIAQSAEDKRKSYS